MGEILCHSLGLTRIGCWTSMVIFFVAEMLVRVAVGRNLTGPASSLARSGSGSSLLWVRRASLRTGLGCLFAHAALQLAAFLVYVVFA